MKKVTLLGDSIRLLYGPIVEKELKKEGVEVFEPEDNCRFAKYTLRMLFDLQDQIQGSNVIHWNNGHWDVCNLFGDGPFSSLEEYLQNMNRIADLLLKITPNVIFATTTPVREGYPYQTDEAIKNLNRAVVPVLARKGIVINDLHFLIESNRDEWIGDDLLHLNEKGASVCAEQTLNIIKRFL